MAEFIRNSWCRVERAYRKADKRVLRNHGVRPAKKQWLTCVETTAIPIPEWAKERASRHLSSGDHHIWFRGRSSVHAKMLVFQDREAGGEPEMTKVEWRPCPVCRRPLLAMEAMTRRRMDESSREGRLLPCFGDCKR